MAWQVRALDGWRRIVSGWGGAVNVAGLCVIALVPENTEIDVHNAGCHLAVIGGAAVLAARIRRGIGDVWWLAWFTARIAFFVVCLSVKAIPFSPWVTTTQKFLICSFAAWAGWVAWKLRNLRGREKPL